MKFKGKMTILAAVLSAIAMVFAVSSAASASSGIPYVITWEKYTSTGVSG
ncbi:MAG: hypothetical protein HDT35_08080, partial [Clostridiales bacterium]|nr:hypothetical protein [Clostridiales bacterium]